jgi:hypothetical protein
MLGFNPSTLELNFGVSKVHKNDNYVKAIGRSVARNKMSKQEAVIDFYIHFDDMIRIRLKSNNLLFTFQIHKNSSKVYLLTALQSN